MSARYVYINIIRYMRSCIYSIVYDYISTWASSLLVLIEWACEGLDTWDE